ncbi:MAG: hypothetical protein A4S12_03880 [Proteobacteria bacterium SG_bin5]|nr:MFS transporter [Sphingomonas sp.]OQW43769.1 MAG: hypothetical protein A4S12_03880 [Proteobacteria bacterium SG_bin5]
MGRALVFMILAGATVLGFAGTDLVLPAVPLLPRALGGSVAQAQYVLASFTGGMAAGLLLFGALAGRAAERTVIAGSLAAYALVSLLCAASPSLPILIALRFAQGMASAAAGVFAPGILRRLYGARAVSALGAIGAIESLAPALAPVAGWALLGLGGWRASFGVLAALALPLALAARLAPGWPPPPPRRAGSYAALLRRPSFLLQALAHAATVAALLVFVFGAPVVFTRVLGTTIAAFIAMQLAGVGLFILASLAAGRLVRWLGTRRLIALATLLGLIGALGLLAYALAGGRSPLAVSLIFLLLNLGLGLRGPAGFNAALVAAAGDEARGAALIVVAMLALPALGTALVAPIILLGLLPIAAAAAVLALLAAAATLTARRLPD